LFAKRSPSTGLASRNLKKGKPALLAGGNPQIAKADGDAPVQAYIAAMPGWKRDVGRHLDALIVRTVPDVRRRDLASSPSPPRNRAAYDDTTAAAAQPR
jgi:hypothetical protein